MTTKKRVPLHKDFDLDVDSIKVKVDFNYTYTHKNRKIEIFRGEILHIITKNANNNEHWVKVLRPNVSKAFYVPRLYVSVIEDEDEEDTKKVDEDEDNEVTTDEDSLRDIDTPREEDEKKKNQDEEGEEQEEDEEECEQYENNQVIIKNCYPEERVNDDYGREQGSGQNQNERLEREQQEGFHRLLPVPTNNNNLISLIENDGERIRIRTSMNLTSEIDIDDNNQSFSSIPSAIIHEIENREMENHHLKSIQVQELLGSSSNSIEGNTSLTKGYYWSESLEELSGQIVFPGQSNLSFSNPGFASNSNCSNISNFSKKSDSSIKRSHEENLDSTAEETEETIPKPENLIRTLQNGWGEYRNSTGRIVYYNRDTNTLRYKPPRFSIKSESCSTPVPKEQENKNENENNNVLVFNVPNGWKQVYDDSTGAVAFIHNRTGEKWFTNTDPNGKLYFYPETQAGEESKSSWFLPEDGTSVEQATSSTASISQQHNDSISNGESSELEDSKKVTHRQYAGDHLDRFSKRRSFQVGSIRKPPDTAQKNSLPWQSTIWGDSKRPEIISENFLNRTKLTENGKKRKKNWATSWAVLTSSHLSFFKDQKTFNTPPIKSDMDLDLSKTRIDWTKDKSSRKNVFEVNSPNLQLLCQSDNQTDAEVWFAEISSVLKTLQTEEEDITLRLKAPSSPKNTLEVYAGETTYNKRRSTTKIPPKISITSTNESKGEIRSHLKKFFHRRPMRDSLIKKGILKDEPVFGCESLEKLTLLDGTNIPKFVTHCIEVIERNEENLKTDGIYRASGNLSQIQKIRFQVDQQNLLILDQEEDVHVLAGALKLFFREMREPMICSNVFDRFLKACDFTPREAKVKEFKKLVSLLPKPNYDTLQFLLEHLLKVHSKSEFNRMQINNLSIVFGPTLMWSTEDTNINMATSLMRQNYVIETLLADFDSIFTGNSQ